MSVVISGADRQQCAAIADALLEALAPAFRHAYICEADSAGAETSERHAL